MARLVQWTDSPFSHIVGMRWTEAHLQALAMPDYSR
jgi:hypothetical protein